MTIGQQIYNGMGIAGWLIGFLVLFGGSLLALFLIVYGIILIAKAGDKAARRREVSRRAGTPATHYQPLGHAPTVGRHVRKGL